METLRGYKSSVTLLFNKTFFMFQFIIFTQKRTVMEKESRIEVDMEVDEEVMYFPNSWRYMSRLKTFYRCEDLHGPDVIESVWYTNKKDAMNDDLSKYFDMSIKEKNILVPSAEKLLIQCYTFLVSQKAQMFVDCLGCKIDHPSQKHHLDGCLADTEQIVLLNEKEARAELDRADLEDLYNDVREELGVGRIFILMDIKAFCESRVLDFDIHPVYNSLMQRLYEDIKSLL